MGEVSKKVSGEVSIFLDFGEAPCECVKRHSPLPLRVEKHHIYPQAEQKKRHGKLVDKTTVPLCDVAHANVHVAIDKRMRGEEYRLRNAYQQEIADAGMEKIRKG